MRLTKRDREHLMNAIEDPVGLRTQIERCLCIVLREPEGEWSQLVDRASTVAGWTISRCEALQAEEFGALQLLATELNELRYFAEE